MARRRRLRGRLQVRLEFIDYWLVVARWLSSVGIDRFELVDFRRSMEWFEALASDSLGCLATMEMVTAVP